MNNISFVAGGAGFIGANLIPQLLARGRDVVVVDNFSRGSAANLGSLANHPALRIIPADLANRDETASAFEQAASLGQLTEVWHLAANSDIPAGVKNPDVDFKDTFCTTFELLRAMQQHGVRQFHFASSSAVYGDLGDTLLHESIGPLLPISNYGAMKLASEAQASAAAESFLDRVNLFRFPNVVGVPATHGILLDLVRKLASNRTELHVLGDGTQQKAYLHVSDVVSAMLTIRDRETNGKVEVVNIGPTDAGVTVKWIAEQVVARISPQASIVYGVGNKGWVGDVPKFNYSTQLLQSFDWKPALGSAEAIRRSIKEIALQLGF